MIKFEEIIFALENGAPFVEIAMSRTIAQDMVIRGVLPNTLGLSQYKQVVLRFEKPQHKPPNHIKVTIFGANRVIKIPLETITFAYRK